MQRVADAWRHTLESQRSTLWVTHAGVMRALHLIAQGRPSVAQASDWPAEPIATGSWQAIDLP